MKDLLVSTLATSPPRRRQATCNELRNRMGVRQVERAPMGPEGRLQWALRGRRPEVQLLLRVLVARWYGNPRLLDNYKDITVETLRDPLLMKELLAAEPTVFPLEEDHDGRRVLLLPWLANVIESAFTMTGWPERDHVGRPAPSQRGEYRDDEWSLLIPDPFEGDNHEVFWDRWFDDEETFWHPAEVVQLILHPANDIDWVGYIADWVHSGEAGDWLRLNLAEALDGAIAWHAELARAAEERRQIATDEQLQKQRALFDARPIVAELSDGWTLRKLETQEQMRLEGDYLDHCIGGYDPNSHDRSYHSVHDPKGMPRVSIQLRLNGENQPPDVNQAYGRANSRPEGERARPTYEAMRHLGVLSPDAQRWTDIEPSAEDLQGDLDAMLSSGRDAWQVARKMNIHMPNPDLLDGMDNEMVAEVVRTSAMLGPRLSKVEYEDLDGLLEQGFDPWVLYVLLPDRKKSTEWFRLAVDRMRSQGFTEFEIARTMGLLLPNSSDYWMDWDVLDESIASLRYALIAELHDNKSIDADTAIRLVALGMDPNKPEAGILVTTAEEAEAMVAAGFSKPFVARRLWYSRPRSPRAAGVDATEWHSRPELQNLPLARLLLICAGWLYEDTRRAGEALPSAEELATIWRRDPHLLVTREAAHDIQMMDIALDGMCWMGNSMGSTSDVVAQIRHKLYKAIDPLCVTLSDLLIPRLARFLEGLPTKMGGSERMSLVDRRGESSELPTELSVCSLGLEDYDPSWNLRISVGTPREKGEGHSCPHIGLVFRITTTSMEWSSGYHSREEWKTKTSHAFSVPLSGDPAGIQRVLNTVGPMLRALMEDQIEKNRWRDDVHDLYRAALGVFGEAGMVRTVRGHGIHERWGGS
jgi:hypothetical protein